jgi:hypothetical protein
VALRLRNQTNPRLTLSLTSDAWFGILDLAEAYGWMPMGTVHPGFWVDLDLDLHSYSLEALALAGFNEAVSERRLVLVEDALNLADALERAFLDYEPARVPSTYYLFETSDPFRPTRPSIGAILAVQDICQWGAFWIEKYYNHETSRTPNNISASL